MNNIGSRIVKYSSTLLSGRSPNLLQVRCRTKRRPYKLPWFRLPEVSEPVTTKFSNPAPPELQFPFRRKRKDINAGGQDKRIDKLRKLVTAVIRYERVEGTYPQTSETRYYVERLIQEAVIFGDRHKRTMHMADYWLLEKDLVHKLFKVLVPRFADFTSAYTRMFSLPYIYPSHAGLQAVLELKGNPYPPVVPSPTDNSKLLTNVLLDALRADFKRQRAAELAAAGDEGGEVEVEGVGSEGNDAEIADERAVDLVAVSPQIINDIHRLKMSRGSTGEAALRTTHQVRGLVYDELDS